MTTLSAHAAPLPTLQFHTIRMPGKSVGMNAINASGNMVGGAWQGALTPATRENCILYATKTQKITAFTDPSANGATECWTWTTGPTSSATKSPQPAPAPAFCTMAEPSPT